MDKIEMIKNIIQNDSNNADAWYLLGLEYREQGLLTQAIQSFSEALKNGNEELQKSVYSELSKISGINNQNIENDYGSNNYSESLFDSDEAESFSDNDKIIPFKIIKGKKDNLSFTDDNKLEIVSFKDVGGLDRLKDVINMKIVKPFLNPGLFDKFKKKTGGGILLFGPPGCGKTYIARATAGECSANFIPVHITDILNPYIGESEMNIKNIFMRARAQKPCILFFDEIDSIGYNRAKLSSEVMRPITDQLLSEIEGISSNTDKLLIIGATNMPWDVDSAFKRPGRFDKTIFVSPPDLPARAIIFELKLKGKPVDHVDYEFLAENTELYSGADIENVVEVATENVINEILKTGNERLISMEDLVQAISITKPTTIDWLKTISNYVKYANQSGLYDDVKSFISNHRRLLV